MFTHRVVKGFSSDSAAYFQYTVASTGGLEVNVDELIPALSTDLLVNFAADVSKVLSLFIVSDVACTIKTNSDIAADNTITLAAGIPFTWTSQDGLPLTDTAPAAISTDITKLYVTSTAAANLKIRCLIDPTA